MATETQKLMYAAQRAAHAPVIAPDVQQQNTVAKANAAQDKKESTQIAAGVLPNAELSRQKMGTKAVYSTLPNNAKKANLSQFFSVSAP